MPLDDPDARSRETAAAGLVKGETACNRSACQMRLNDKDGSRMWNTETQAFYCQHCARRINISAIASLGHAICITESEKWQRDSAPLLEAAARNITKPNFK
jgi:hypothetical protein